MAAVGAEVTGSWFLSSGVVGFLGFLVLLVLLSIFITALCSHCNRHSFDLQHSGVDRNPPALIKVVRLEETRENPMINEIQNDEKQFRHDEENPVGSTPWRSHLGAPNTSHGMNHAPSPPDSAHIMAEGSDTSSPAANQEPEQQQRRVGVDLSEKNSVYARVSKKQNMEPAHTPEEEEEQEEEQEEEEASPPLPDRTEMELWN
ncbi:uncharacterized protein si:ch73-204p21.2 [Mugil cephalus]|uniref:uncharacterized protein si:ch73-204p21.2 n=1 Tax=Mugil cephalus TaxID=48193 RepID=UPI001FB731C7|nr:uncharacterized protein si:ch73-204p21.2 [Mugil cephalus]XP_047435857.1 uncharacterized protein si:ch73-204p21.2 [Mugil cephalus]